MDSSMSIAGSLASARAVERFLMSPTPMIMGISRVVAMVESVFGEGVRVVLVQLFSGM